MLGRPDDCRHAQGIRERLGVEFTNGKKPGVRLGWESNCGPAQRLVLTLQPLPPVLVTLERVNGRPISYWLKRYSLQRLGNQGRTRE